MNGLLENVDPADILAYARRVPTPEDFLLTREIIPETFINNVKFRIKSRTSRVSTAKFRAWDSSTPRGRREVEHQVMEGMLPPLGTEFTIGELESILLAISRGQDDQELVDELYDDTERHVLGIKSRLEEAAGDLFDDGIFELDDENGLTIEADWDVPEENLPTATAFWNDSNADAVDQERLWMRRLRRRPGRAVSSRDVAEMLATNAQYKQHFYGSETVSNAAGRPTLFEGQVNEVRARAGLPPLSIYDATVVDGGVEKRVLHEGKFLLVPADSSEFAETQYGITAEALSLPRGGGRGLRIEREEQPGIVVTAEESDNPVRVYTKSAAVAMPVLYDNQGFISAQVLPRV